MTNNYLKNPNFITKTESMDNSGPIIVIEDDEDDREILQSIFKKMKIDNEVLFFFDGESALDYLKEPKVIPFLIISDVNMPRINGFELRDKLRTDAAIAIRCIPYLFFSTAMNQKSVIDAYSNSSQGFFVKGNSMAEIEKTIFVIVEYWKLCAAPNNFPN